MATAIGNICVYAFYWSMSHELFAKFPRKDGDPMTLAPCRFLRGRVQSQALTRSSSHRGNGHCAQDSHHHHAVDTLLSSVAPPPLRRLDHTKHHLAPAWDADRPGP